MFLRAIYLNYTTVLVGQSEGLPQVNMTNARSVAAQNRTIPAKEGLLQNGQKGYGASGSTQANNATSMVGLNLSDNSNIGSTLEDTLIAQNPIYGSSNHVTPTNASVKIWQRIS